MANTSCMPWEHMKRTKLVRKESKTSASYGCEPEKRSVEELLQYGIINVDKPKGPTSHQVSAYVQQILDIKKSGHSGTLDPKVTGVLPVALGNGTRIVQALLVAGKEYMCVMHLHDEVKETKIRDSMLQFIGKIKQLPPIKSAVKRQWRFRTIYYIDIIDIDGQDVLFRVGCQAGTYIRKLCLHPDTEVLTGNGLMTIKEFYDCPREIYSEKNGKIVKRFPEAVQRIPSPKKLIKIKISSGIEIVATPDHELLTSTKKGYKMVEVGKLKKGAYLVKSLKFYSPNKEYCAADLLDDKYLAAQKEIKELCKKAFTNRYGSIREMNRVLKLDRKAFLTKSEHAIPLRHLKLAGIYEKVKKQINTFKTEKGTLIKLDGLDDRLLYLLGLVASDGNNTKEKNTIRHTRIKFHNNDENLIDNFLQTYKKLFPTVPISKKQVRGDLWQLDTSNSLLATLAASLGIKSPQKDHDILPILFLKPKLIKAFLRGYFDGDGTAYFKKKTKIKGHYTDIYLFTISYVSAKRLHQMLLKLDIPNKIFRKKDGMNVVSLESMAAKHKFIREIGTNSRHKKIVLDKINSLTCNESIDGSYHVGLHYKQFIRDNNKKLHKMGGNLSRVLTTQAPMTRYLYEQCSKLAKLPDLDDCVIEKITSIEPIRGDSYVYDLTVPETHNFLIENGIISSNCHDMGTKMGTGAHMAELRRTKAGPFNEENLAPLIDVKDAYTFYKEERNDKWLRKIIQPIEKGVDHLPKVWVTDSTVDTLCHGADLAVPGVASVETDIQLGEIVAVMTLKGELIALGEARMISKDIQKKPKGIAIKTNKVFLPIGTYPKLEKEPSSSSK